MNERETIFYPLHKEGTDVWQHFPKEIIHTPLPVRVIYENQHHWIFLHDATNTRFTVVKFPSKSRGTDLPPFKTIEKAEAYLAQRIPTFDSDGHRM